MVRDAVAYAQALGVATRFAVRDRFPDQLGDVEDEVGLRLPGVRGRANLADADAHRIVEPPILRRVAGVKDRPDDLAAPGWIGPPIPVPLEHDHGPVLGLDDGAEVRPKRSIRTMPAGEVRAAEAAADSALAPALGEEEVLLPAAVEADHPALWIGEPNPVQRLEPQDEEA